MTPPAVAVEDLSLSVGHFHLRKIDFALSDGEILVILGPNGAGKSVILETIAGFHRPSAGRIVIDGRDVTQLPPERRNVAFLVQSFGLFPHLTVQQNVTIAVRRPGPGAARHATALPHGDVGKLLDYFGIARLAQSTPHGLSPGERQRVALARALAAEPDLFLFDEPFSALDASTRDQLREELLALLRGLSIPAIFVTHDHADAMALADKIIVLRGGAIVQSGSVDDIFYKPANAFVAGFVGVENILAGQVIRSCPSSTTIAIGAIVLQLAAADARPGREVQVSIRAEAVSIHPDGHAPASALNRLTARVTGLRVLGPLAAVQIDAGLPLKAYVMAQRARDLELAIGQAIEVDIPPEAIHLMDVE